MTIVKHEWRRGKSALLIWTAAIGFLLCVCVLLFPQMKEEMAGLSEAFSSMGAFTAAFGMDRLSFGTLTGYYAIECGNVLGLGGAFFAALCAVNMLSKEEKERTAEFLLTHPISRVRIVTEKLLALLLQVTAMNAAVFALSLGAMALIGEAIPWRTAALLHLAYYLLQLELTGICFGISACLRRGGVGVGLGLAALLYVLNLMANISPTVDFLKYITPFAYCDGADIAASGALHGTRVAIGMTLGLLGVAVAYRCYPRKDIH